MATPLGAAPSSRARILDVAEARFARRGFAGVGLREVAGEAGLGKSSLFHHFRSKAALYRAVLHRVIEGLDARVAAALEGGGAAAERLERCIDALVDALAARPSAARLLLRALFEQDELPERAEDEEAVDEALDRVVERLRALLRQGIADGDLRPVSEVDTLQTLIGATVYHFASGDFGAELLGEPLFDPEAVARRKRELKAFFRAGLAGAAPSSREA